MSADQATQPPPVRCVTIDVEEYFHIEAAHGRVRWEDWPRRCEEMLEELLSILREANCRATLFFLGHVAKEHPALARHCAWAGHEIACHGDNHDHLARLGERDFREDVTAAKKRLEDQIGQPVLGYRAPSWSITRQTAWALDVLIEAGFAYDASIFPVRHPGYGVPDAPVAPYLVRSAPGKKPILEVPPLVWRKLGQNIPAAGGAYFRIFPLFVMKRALAVAAKKQRPAILYFHPWEFDVVQPALPLSWRGRLRTYTGIGKAKSRLEKLLALPGTWEPIGEHIGSIYSDVRQQPVFTLSTGELEPKQPPARKAKARRAKSKQTK
ncbi:MAG: polysaccharide deacetylase family protein [Phycisphaeraceae bacterium]